MMKNTTQFRKQNRLFNYTEKDFDKCGWLKKQGGTFKTMKRRYFALIKNNLYYFTNQTKTTLKGQINLWNLELSELEEDKNNGDFIFAILPEHGHDNINETHERYQMASNDKSDAESWMQHLKQNMYLKRGGGLFGTSLDIVALYLEKEYHYVPRIVHECCQRIREIGMDEEGIFRKNGQKSLVLQMKSNVDRADYNWDDVDIHTICSLLKLYLRELPEPLIPFCHYDSLKAIGYRIDVGEDLDLVRSKLKMLPPPNLQLLKYLCEFLLEVSTHRHNRMEIDSLAKVFSPNILRDRDTDPYIEESTSTLISVTVAAFIKSQNELFIFEYEPLEKCDKDYLKDDDTYSVISALATFNLIPPFGTFEDISGSATSLQDDRNITERANSIPFTPQLRNHSDRIKASTRLASRDCTDSARLQKRVTLATINSDKIENCTNATIVCDRCQSLECQLKSVGEERDSLAHTCEEQSKKICQMQSDIDFLREQLKVSIRLRSENNSDLLDILSSFDIN